MGTIRSSSPVLDASGNPASRRIVLAYRRDTGALIGRGMTSDGAGDASLSSVELLMLTRGYNDSLAVMDYSPNQKAITLAGNVKLTTAQGRYENASLVLDGNNDYLRVTSPDLAFGTGDATIEQFIRRTGTTASNANNDMLVWDLRDPLDTGLLVYIGGQDVAFPLRFYVGAADRISGASITADTWFHVAWSRIAGVSRLFIDGVQQGSNYTDTTNYTSEVLTIGGRYTPASGDYRSFNGNLGALRVTNGVGRYAAGFTPPSAPPQAFDNTLGAGHYQIDTGSYAGECTVVLLDDFEGDTQNDLVLRTTPV
jgi:Concanavalin A-like lectin/glucanases superfamily